jgi:hypothetical protein
MRFVFNMILHCQVEIGNYDSFYEKGVIFTPEQVKNVFQYSILFIQHIVTDLNDRYQ